MTDREFILICWRLMIAFIRACGRKNGLCSDVIIIKTPGEVQNSVVEL